MSSERQPNSMWSALFGRRPASGPDPKMVPPKATGATEMLRIEMAEERRRQLEAAIPFHRPADKPAAAPGAPFQFGPLEPGPEPSREAKSSEKPVSAEPYRKKYKKYGRDVCMPGEEGEPYDVLADNSDQSHRGVDSVSPL